MPSIRTLFLAIATTASALLFGSVAQARPKLLTSDPLAGAEVAAPAKIKLHFSETLTTHFSGAKLMEKRMEITETMMLMMMDRMASSQTK
ncbi:copper resistance protein CopC [Burkholderia sp. BE17]|uniref:copper resistance protein CopC n=1 Tax=Burkholderia sp. BE17 TaxID=2656644 RepID=UPI00187B5B0F|nr:copper resistance protein CopC [Burkholderia sp. BE17]